jgi:uncharacterized protein (UPF0333 family)
VIIVVIVVVVVGVGAYVATRGSKSSSSSAPMITPAPTSASTATPTPASTSKSDIGTASSYEFNETGKASNGTVLDTLYYATKNLGTSNVDLLEAWAYENGQWTDISTEYTSVISTVEASAGLYVNMLEGWGGSGSFTYTIPSGQPNAGDTATFTNIQINSSLPDSVPGTQLSRA